MDLESFEAHRVVKQETRKSLRVAMEKKSSCFSKVCVTGGAGYIGSSLVKKLLEKGYIVHATLRNLDDPLKVGLLRSLPDAHTRLILFKADIYSPEEFEPAIQGCEFVFHVATPFQHSTHNSQYNNISEAAVGGVESIVRCCIRSGTVRRLIYTASAVSASPLKEDGTGFRDLLDESCWTPLSLSFDYCNDFLKEYTKSKTLAEKEVLSHSCKDNSGLEVVSLNTGLVGGETLLSYLPESMSMLISQPLNNMDSYQVLRFLEELLGKVPIIHIGDVCEAHIFCMEKHSVTGRFFCASAYLTTKEIVKYIQQYYPELHIANEFLGGPERGVKWGSTKLNDMGFEYKYDVKVILDDTIESARRVGALK